MKYGIYRTQYDEEAKENVEVLIAYASSLEYQGDWMSSRYVQVDVKSPKELQFAVGDYLNYRGERFEIKSLMDIKKQANSGSYGEAFTYSNIKLESLIDELSATLFLDYTWTEASSNLSGTLLSEYSFHCVDVNDLVNRILANMKRAKKQGLISAEWTFDTSNIGSGSGQVQGNTDVTIDVSNITCLEALKLIYDQFALSYKIDKAARNIVVGGAEERGTFLFGKNNGLRDITRSVNTDYDLITRLRAVGSTKNLPYHYYYYKSLYGNDWKAVVSTTKITKHTHVSTSGEYGYYYLLTLNGGVEFENGATANVKINDTVISNVTLVVDSVGTYFYSDGLTEAQIAAIDDALNSDSDNYSMVWKISASASAFVNCPNSYKYLSDWTASFKVYHTDFFSAVGTNKYVLYAEVNGNTTSALPDGIELISGGSVTVTASTGTYTLTIGKIKNVLESGTNTYIYLDATSLTTAQQQELKESSESLSKSAGVSWTITGDSTAFGEFSVIKRKNTGGNAALLAIDTLMPDTWDLSKIDPYFDSANISKYGIREGFVKFDSDDDEKGIEEIYPTIENSNNYVTIGSTITDNGIFTEEEVSDGIKDFYITIANIGFNLNYTQKDGVSNYGTLCMTSGMCGGREFTINSVTYNSDGTQKLRLSRVEDDGLSIYLPSSDYPIAAKDTFVITDIEMPESYITTAESNLTAAAKDYLSTYDHPHYTYGVSMDNIFLARDYETNKTSSKYYLIKEGDFMLITDTDLVENTSENIITDANGTKHTQTVRISIDKLTIKESEGKIPQVSVTLRNEKKENTIVRITKSVSAATATANSASTAAKKRVTASQARAIANSVASGSSSSTSGTNVTYAPTQTYGNEIGVLTIDGTPNTLYSPDIVSEAKYATGADHATEADHATSADTATNATNAKHADSTADLDSDLQTELEGEFLRKDQDDTTEHELTVQGLTVVEQMEVGNDAKFKAGVEVAGDLDVTEATTLKSTLDVKGTSEFEKAATFDTSATVKGSATVNGNASVGTNLTVVGTSTLKGNTNEYGDLTFGESGTDKAYTAGTRGCKIYWTGNGWRVDADYLSVNRKMYAKEIEVNKVTHVGGEQLLTAASCIADHVGNSGSDYKVYFRSTDGEGRQVTNDFVPGDLAYCQTFNINTTEDFTNKYYWRLVVFVGTEGEYNYIVLSSTIYDGMQEDTNERGAMATDEIKETQGDDIGGDIPSAGDQIIQLGFMSAYNTSGIDSDSIKERQGATLISGAGNHARSLIMWEKIDSFGLPTEKILLSPSEVKMTVDSLSITTTGGTQDFKDYVSDNLAGRLIINGDTADSPESHTTTSDTFIQDILEKVYGEEASSHTIADLVGTVYITSEKMFYLLTYNTSTGEYSWVEDTDGTLKALYDSYETLNKGYEEILDDNIISANEIPIFKTTYNEVIETQDKIATTYNGLEESGETIPSTLETAYLSYYDASEDYVLILKQIVNNTNQPPYYLNSYSGTVPSGAVVLSTISRNNIYTYAKEYSKALYDWNNAYSNYKIGNISDAAIAQAESDVQTTVTKYVNDEISKLTGEALKTTIDDEVLQFYSNGALDAEGNTIKTTIEAVDGKVTALSSSIDEKGYVTNNGLTATLKGMFAGSSVIKFTYDGDNEAYTVDISGIYTSDQFASVVSQVCDKDGNIVKAASLSAFIKDEDGVLISYASILADKVYIESGSKAMGDYFSVQDGKLYAQNITIADSGTFGGTVSIADKILLNADGSGSLANGNITWDADGSNLKAQNITIEGDGTFSGTVSIADKILLNEDGSGSLASGNITWDADGSNLKAQNITIEGGGTFSGTVSIADKIKLNSDGSGSLANGNISWDADGSNLKAENITINGGGTFSGKLSAAYGTFDGYVQTKFTRLTGNASLGDNQNLLFPVTGNYEDTKTLTLPTELTNVGRKVCCIFTPSSRQGDQQSIISGNIMVMSDDNAVLDTSIRFRGYVELLAIQLEDTSTACTWFVTNWVGYIYDSNGNVITR